MVAFDLRVGGYSECSMNSTTPTGSGSAAEAPPPAGVRVNRRLVGWCAAVAFVLAGLGMLGFVAWEYVGTDVIAEKRQSDIRADLRASWQYPTVPDVLGPQAADATLGAADALVRIPRFGANYEVPMIEGVRNEDLNHGIGHFPGTGPGQIGNFALAAYRETHAGPFREIASLRPGDRVMVETAEAVYTYRLDTDPNDLDVPLSQSWVTDPVPVPPRGTPAPPGMPVSDSREPTRALITLASCSELFHRDDRMVAFGHLISITPK
jgi:sortase A